MSEPPLKKVKFSPESNITGSQESQAEEKTPSPPKSLRFADEIDEMDIESESEPENINKENVIDLSAGEEYWFRPKVPNIDPDKDNIVFMQMECDTTSSLPLDWSKGPYNVPVVRFYGCTSNSNSVCCHVYGFWPYFYSECPSHFQPRDCAIFQEAINRNVQDRAKNCKDPCLAVEIVYKSSIYEYHFGKLSPFLKITVNSPRYVPTVRSLLIAGILFNNTRYSLRSYESNFPFTLRMMVDLNIQGGSWLEIPAGAYSIRQEKKDNKNFTNIHKESRCDIEINAIANKIISHAPIDKWQVIAPIRILSFDIECAGRKGQFPDPEIDPVIQIANVVTVQGSDSPIVKNVFCLNTCAQIVGSQVFSFKTEKELLEKWQQFVLTVDPDILTGYNIINFDINYLIKRAQALKLDIFSELGRLIGEKSRVKDTKFSSRAYGTHENKEINMAGRVQFDLLQIIRRDYKLSSYTLNSVSAHFLNKVKEDVHHSIITDLQNGTAETRRRLAEYCIKDALLPQLLLDKLMLIVNYMEMARVTGVPFNFIMTRGQQIKVVSQLYRAAKPKNMIIPLKERVRIEDKYEGATVIDPIKGFYRDPISTLDFASLYPSIMIAHNLCYSTLVSRKDINKLSPEQYERTPCGAVFIRSSVQKGLLPEIVDELLKARKRAKSDLKKATDPFVKAVLNGRQLALKVSANSVYGFTGAQVGQLPCLEISSSVTAYGRQMIDLTKETVENHYTIANGYEHDAKVIYGDTDSVMVKFGTEDIKESISLGQEAAKFVTNKFPFPIRLEFEKVYSPYLLMNKKRYAGLLWTSPEKWSKMDAKGIETVRRDNCALVRDLIQTSLHKILMEKDPDSAIQYCKNIISDLLCNRIDLSLIIISKSLGKEDYKAKQPHIALAEKLRKRDPMAAPGVGDRVAYVITQGSRNQPAFERSEDPIYVLKNSIPIDVQYYLEHQLQKPLERIFEPVLGAKVASLFTGDHTRAIKQVVNINSNKGLMKFMVRQKKCIGCKCVLTQYESSVCSKCKGLEAILYSKQIAQVRAQEKIYSQVWVQCQRCQGSLHDDIICTNKDCPIFYRRTKTQIDLAQAYEQLDKFSF